MKKFLAYLLSIALFVSIYTIVSYPYGRVGTEVSYASATKSITSGEVSSTTVIPNTRIANIIMKDGSKFWVTLPNTNDFISFTTEEIQEGMEFNLTIDNSYEILGFLSVPVKTNVKFDDVAGIDEVKAQIMDVVDYLTNPDKYTKIGAKLPKGVLLSGKPGTGKTLLARAIAGEAGVNFFQVTGSSFEEKFVGVGASRIRELFEVARKSAPSIIFIDEIDSVAKTRYDMSSRNEQTLNQLLAEMDGFDNSSTVVVIAATNHIEVLDEAILRPGRFDRCIEVPMPGLRARELILELHAKNKVISEEVSLKSIASRTVGFSGADIANLLNEAAIYAVRTGKSMITNEDIDEAIARIMVGLRNNEEDPIDKEIHLKAIHEAGHAVVSAVLRPNIKNLCISIVSRGNAGGYNFFNENDSIFKSKEDLINHIKVSYGGRVAEEIILGSISTGASSDLKVANKIALQMVENYGMSDSLLVRVDDNSNYNKILTTKAMEKVEAICGKAYEEVKEIVIKYADTIMKLAKLLEEKEYLSENEVAEFMSENV